MPGPFPSLSYSIAWLSSNIPQSLWECCWSHNEWVVGREEPRAVKGEGRAEQRCWLRGHLVWTSNTEEQCIQEYLEHRLGRLSLCAHYRHLNLGSAVELSVFIYLFDAFTLGNFLGKGKVRLWNSRLNLWQRCCENYFLILEMGDTLQGTFMPMIHLHKIQWFGWGLYVGIFS